jgi:outer membrane protein assembly factor BamB
LRLSTCFLAALLGVGCPAGTVGGLGDGGTTPDGGGGDGGPPPDGGSGDGGTPSDGGVVAITTFGVHGSRDSLYVDPAFTKARLTALAQSGGLKRDSAFAPAVQGDVYASPLFLEAGIGGKDVLFIATEENHVYAIDAASGTVLWDKLLGTPVTSGLNCGNINPLGVTSTPVLDVSRRILIVSAAVDVSGVPHNQFFALSIDNGGVAWTIDVNLNVNGFDTATQGQRASLLLLNDVVYVPFGGYYGDCPVNYGYVMGVPLSNPTLSTQLMYKTPGQGGAIWAPNGIATDGVSIFAVTGNGEGTQNAWSDGDSDALLRLSAGLVFSGQPADYFAFNQWAALSGADADLGSNGTVLFELPGAGSGHLALLIGKSLDAWLVDRSNLGGINTPDKPLAHLAGVASGDASGGMASYQTPSGRYVAYNAPCGNGTLGVLKVTAGNPPTLTQAFCVSQGASGADQGGSPIVTTSDGSADAVVWGNGGFGDNQLYAVDGETGALLVKSTGIAGVIHWVAPLVAKGSIYLPGNGTVYAFRVK